MLWCLQQRVGGAGMNREGRGLSLGNNIGSWEGQLRKVLPGQAAMLQSAGCKGARRGMGQVHVQPQKDNTLQHRCFHPTTAACQR